MSILQSLLGAIPVVGPALSGVADVLGGASAGDQKAQTTADQAKLGKGNLALARDKFAISAPGDRLKQGILASLASSATPTSVKWGGPGSGMRGEVPTWSGGIKSIYPALQNTGVRSLAGSSLEDELAQQMGNHDASLGDAASVGDASTGSKLLGAGALGSGLLAAILKGFKPGAGGAAGGAGAVSTNMTGDGGG